MLTLGFGREFFTRVLVASFLRAKTSRHWLCAQGGVRTLRASTAFKHLLARFARLKHPRQVGKKDASHGPQIFCIRSRDTTYFLGGIMAKPHYVRFFVRSLLFAAPLLWTGCALPQPQGQGAVLETLSLDVSDVSPAIGQDVIYRWTPALDASYVCELDIDGDGEVDHKPPCSKQQQVHSFDASGSFTATLKVTGQGQEKVVSGPVITVGNHPSVNLDTFKNISWRAVDSVDYGLAEAQSIAVDDKMYVFGGFDSESPHSCCRPSDRAFVFDPKTEAWTQLSPMPAMNKTPYGGVNHAGFTTDGTDIFFGGGYTSNASHSQHAFGTEEVWRYEVATDSYERLPDLPEARGSGVMEYIGGKLYFVGGSTFKRQKDVGDLFILDYAGGAKTWTRGATMPVPRNHLASAVFDGKMVVIAGQEHHDRQLITVPAVTIYDPASDTWQEAAPIPEAISHHSHATFIVGERIIVMGGETHHLEGIAKIHAYTPRTDSWTELASELPRAWVSPVARYVGGKIVVTGGWKPETWIGTLEP